MYISRHAEKTVEKLAKMFSSVLVAGPRQVGKTTMLQNMTRGIRYVTMDDPVVRAGAKDHNITFFKDNPPPVFIDEIQRTPELFIQMKLLADRSRKKGQFYLCGSQQFRMMKGVSESLAGRLGMVTLLGLSLREKYGVAFDEPFLPTEDYLQARGQNLADISYNDIWRAVQRGGMPELSANDDFDWQMFYGSYVSTYIDRDVSELSQVGDTVKFIRFMEVMAGRTGQLLNLQSVANDVGVSQPTADRWLSVLAASNVVYLLRPYSNNLTKRAVKTPKLYFLDTGLAAYLTRWNTPEAMKNGAMAGAFFETFVVSEIIKSYYNRGILEPPVYFYRDRDMAEVDIIIEENNVIYPIEVKKHADPSSKDLIHFSVIDRLAEKSDGMLTRGPGGVICLYDDLVTLKGADRVIPVKYL